MKLLVALLLVSFVVSLPATPQVAQPVQTTQPKRDPQAVAVVQGAIAAMGGAGATSQVQSVVAQGSIQASQGSWLTSGSFTWENAGPRYRYDNPHPQGHSVLVSGTRGPMVSSGGVTEKVHSHVTATMFPPHLLALVLPPRFSNANCSFELVGNDTVDGRAVVHVRTALHDDDVFAVISVQDWYLDAGSLLPVRVAYLLPMSSDAMATRSAAITFANYHNVSGILIPFQMSFYLDGQFGGTATLTSVSFNVTISPTDFDSPSGGGQ